MAARENGGGLVTDINVTPLVDVVLVLLILMMVTATAIANRTITVELPHAKSGAKEDTQKPLVVMVDEGGVLSIDGARVSDDDVRARAKGQESAIVAADGRARHEAVVRALEMLRAEHLSRISIMVKP